MNLIIVLHYLAYGVPLPSLYTFIGYVALTTSYYLTFGLSCLGSALTILLYGSLWPPSYDYIKRIGDKYGDLFREAL